MHCNTAYGYCILICTAEMLLTSQQISSKNLLQKLSKVLPGNSA